MRCVLPGHDLVGVARLVSALERLQKCLGLATSRGIEAADRSGGSVEGVGIIARAESSDVELEICLLGFKTGHVLLDGLEVTAEVGGVGLDCLECDVQAAKSHDQGLQLGGGGGRKGEDCRNGGRRGGGRGGALACVVSITIHSSFASLTASAT